MESSVTIQCLPKTRGVARLREWLHRLHDAREARSQATLRDARAAVQLKFRDWLDAADRLNQLSPKGWADPAYANALTCERAYYRALMSIHRHLRRDSLPL